jgi:hypothetical protein
MWRCTACRLRNWRLVSSSPRVPIGTWPYCSFAPCSMQADDMRLSLGMLDRHSDRNDLSSICRRHLIRLSHCTCNEVVGRLTGRTHQVLEQALGVGEVLGVREVEAEVAEHVVQVGLEAGARVVVEQAAGSRQQPRSEAEAVPSLRQWRSIMQHPRRGATGNCTALRASPRALHVLCSTPAADIPLLPLRGIWHVGARVPRRAAFHPWSAVARLSSSCSLVLVGCRLPLRVVIPRRVLRLLHLQA